MAPVILIALYACIIPVGKEEGDGKVFCSPGIVTAFISFHNQGEAIGLLFGVDKGMGGKEQWLFVDGHGIRAVGQEICFCPFYAANGVVSSMTCLSSQE